MLGPLALLYLIVILGFYSSGQLAWRQWSTGEACPVVGSVPACYVAFVGYVLILIGLVGSPGLHSMRYAFYGGLIVAGGLALVGSLMEMVKGNVCPRAGSIPMCYVSLAMTLLLGVLFRFVRDSV